MLIFKQRMWRNNERNHTEHTAVPIVKYMRHEHHLNPPPAIVSLVFVYEVLRSHSQTLHSVGLLWTSDRPVAGTSN